MTDCDESGRSMVEMLGTLAMIGVLSVVGLMGYRRLIDGIKANTLLNEVNKRAYTCTTQFGFMNATECTFGEYPEQIDGKYTTSPINMNNGYFGIQVEGVPQSICQQIHNKGMPSASSILPETCEETNTMKFVFENMLEKENKCTENSDCKTVCGVCTEGVCVGECPTEQGECSSDSNCPGVCVGCVKENPEDETGVCKACEPVQYLESTGTQYIDTGFEAKSTTRMVIKGSVVDKTASYSLIGTYGSTSRFQVLYSQTATPAGLSIGYGNAPFNLGINDTNVRVYEIDGVNKKAYVDNVEVANFSSAAFTQSGENLWIFARSVAVNYGKDKIYYCKIWDNGTLVRDFIPVLDPRGTPTMYDKKNNVLYYNAGTGKFLYGKK